MHLAPGQTVADAKARNLALTSILVTTEYSEEQVTTYLRSLFHPHRIYSVIFGRANGNIEKYHESNACVVCKSLSSYIVWSKQRQVQFLKRTCYLYPHCFWRDDSQPSLAVRKLGKDLHRHTYATTVEALGTTTPGILKEGHSILKDEVSTTWC